WNPPPHPALSAPGGGEGVTKSRRYEYRVKIRRCSAPLRRGQLLPGAGVGHAAALSLHPQKLVAAHPGAAVLADPADADLGVHEPVPAWQQLLYRAGLRRAARRGDAVGPAVPQPARPVDLVP